MNKEAVISVLIRTLQENRDGLILINGTWGVGKTHFLQTEFRIFYSDVSHFYMSVLGLHSLQDFKDRVLSVTYLDNPEEIKKLGGVAASATSALTQEEGAGKLVEQITSLLSGAMKEYVLKDLSGVFIIDDLERIPQDLRDEIATYCLQNYQKHSKLDYILVGNFSSQSKEVLNHREKVISDEIYFSISNIYEFLDSKLICVDEQHKKLITDVILGFKENNLRIINRVIIKLLPLIEDELPDNKFSEVDMKNLVSSLCAHMILKEKFSYLESDFHTNYLTSSVKTLTANSENDEDEISKEESNLLNVANYSSYQNLMVPYCFNVISKRDILPYIFVTKESLDKKDYAAITIPELSNINEKDYLLEIEKIIVKTESPELSTWLTATSNYLRLSESKYIPKIKGLKNKIIEDKKSKFSNEEIKLYFYQRYPNIDDIPLHILKRDGDDLHNYFLKKFEQIIKNEKIKSIKDKMISEGWSSINMDVYQSTFKFKILETLGVNEIISAVKTSWSVYDIRTFSNHLLSLYNFSNLSDFLADELPHLKKLYTALNYYKNRIESSFRRGAIIELVDNVKFVKDSLEKSIASKVITH